MRKQQNNIPINLQLQGIQKPYLKLTNIINETTTISCMWIIKNHTNKKKNIQFSLSSDMQGQKMI